MDTTGSPDTIVLSTSLTTRCFSLVSLAACALFDGTIVSTRNVLVQSVLSSSSAESHKRLLRLGARERLSAQYRNQVEINVGAITIDFLKHLQGEKSSARRHDRFGF